MPETSGGTAGLGTSRQFIPLEKAWIHWAASGSTPVEPRKTHLIRTNVLCQECHWIVSWDFPCPLRFRSVLAHPQCAAACFKSIAKRQSERRT